MPTTTTPTKGFPVRIIGRRRWSAQEFYEPTDRGFEARVKERLDYWNERRKELQQSGESGLTAEQRERMYDQSAYWQAQMMNWGPKILIAILILIATWVVARAVKWVLQKAIDRTPALKRHMTGAPDETVGHQLGTIAKLIIWLVGIMAALQFLGIGADPRARSTSW